MTVHIGINKAGGMKRSASQMFHPAAFASHFLP